MPHLPGNETGLDDSSSSSLDIDSGREQYCDLHTTLFGTVAFQAAMLGMANIAILSSWNAIRLFSFSSTFFRRRVRDPMSRYSRRTIENTSRWAARAFPTNGHKPDLVEGVVTTPLLALHLMGRLILDMFTSKLAKVCQLKCCTLFRDLEGKREARGNIANLLQHQVLLLIFAFVQGCIRLYPAHDPHFHRVQHEGWTFHQILAILVPLSPLALVVHELFNGGSRAWYTSRNQPVHITQATVITRRDDPSHDRSKELSAIHDGHLKDNGTGLDARLPPSSNDQSEDNDGPDGATAVLDSPEYRSSKWMFIAVWLLVSTVTLLASAKLIYIYVGFSDPQRLPTLLFATLMTLPASCYAWAPMGLHIWSETAYFKSGYRHGSRFITWITTPNASHLMMLTAAFGPLGVFLLTLLDVLASQNPSPLGTPGRQWAWYLFLGSYWAIVTYFLESIMINLIVLIKRRWRR